MNNPTHSTGDQRWLRPQYPSIAEYIRDRLAGLGAAYDPESDWIRGQRDFYRLALTRAEQMNLRPFLRAHRTTMANKSDSYTLGRRQACEALIHAMGQI